MSCTILQLLSSNEPAVSLSKVKEHSNLASSTSVRIKCAGNKDVLVHIEVITAVPTKFDRVLYKPAIKDRENSFDKTNHFNVIDTGTPFRLVFVAVFLLYYGKAFIVTEDNSVENELHKLNSVLRTLLIRPKVRIEEIGRVPTGHTDLDQFQHLKLRVCVDGVDMDKSLFNYGNDAEISVNSRVSRRSCLSINSRDENCFCEIRDCGLQLFTLKELSEHRKTHHKETNV